MSSKTTLRAILENFIDNKSSSTVSSYESAVIPLLEWFCTPKGELAYNLKMQNKMNATKTTLVEVMEFHGSQIAFEEINGKMMINATQMAKPFGKTPKDWLSSCSAEIELPKRLINSEAMRSSSKVRSAMSATRCNAGSFEPPANWSNGLSAC